VPSSNRLLDAAREIQDFCGRKHWPFCFIGGIAVLHWGEPRLTRDADLTVFTGVGNETGYVEDMLRSFAPRVEDAHAFALQHRVLLLRAANGIPLDVSLGALGFEERAVSSASLEEIAPGISLRLCSPSALVVYKVFAGRAQDWLDVEGIVAKSGKRIDREEVRRELAELLELKGEPESLQRLEKILSRTA
jgi:hypothetical protein